MRFAPFLFGMLVLNLGTFARLPAASALDLSNARIPVEEILNGGPAKDGIPALTDPKFILAREATYLVSEDRVLGLLLGGEARAYPIQILNWHELVNDQLGGEPVLVSYCPLCASGMAFEPRVGGERIWFGVSGKLYNSDVLFYDRKTESLWSQLKMEAVTGSMAGKKLTQLPMEHTSWGRWKELHPETTVLSLNTGYSRDYGRNPYLGYEQSASTYFPVSHRDNRLFSKAWVIGVQVNGETKAYPFEALERVKGPLNDRLGGRTLVVEYDSDSRTAWITDSAGETIPSVTAYWFAWAAFHPDTQLFESE